MSTMGGKLPLLANPGRHAGHEIHALCCGAALAQATAASAAPVSPECGGIGRGFILSQRMYGGSRAFKLHFLPPASAMRTNGVKLTGPFELMIRFFKGGHSLSRSGAKRHCDNDESRRTDRL